MSDSGGTPRPPSRWRALLRAAPVLLLVGVCGWCAFGYRLRCAWVWHTTDAARLHRACQNLLGARAPFIAGEAPEVYTDRRDEIPPSLREWRPESVRVFKDRVDVQLGGTIGGSFGFVSGSHDGAVTGTEVIDGLRWYCSE